LSVGNFARRVGNELYKFAFPVYRPLYSAFKTYADRLERDLLQQDIKPGSVVVDAGANIGIYSEFLSTCVGSNGVVHSFEPDITNFKRLQAALAHTRNVQLNQLALSDRSGESSLYVSENLNVDHRAYPTEGEPRKSVAIRSIRLDDYFRPGERVDFIKMDIQGFELHALRGATRVLDENPGVALLLEFWPYGLQQAGASVKAFLSFLKDRNFALSLPEAEGFDPAELADLDSSNPSHYLNLFAKKRGARTE
jgi:FkbM family methyltransferase